MAKKDKYYWLPKDIPKSLESYFLHISNMRQYFDQQILESVRFFTAAIFSLSTVSISVITLTATVIEAFDIQNLARIIIICAILFFPICTLTVTWIGWNSTRLTYRRFMEVVASIAKMEKILGMHTKVPDECRVFSLDDYIVSNRYAGVSSIASSTEDFVDHVTKFSKKDSYWKRTHHLFYVFYASSILIIIFAIALAIDWLGFL